MPTGDDVQQVSLGADLFAARLVEQACIAEGIRVRLLATETGAHPNSMGGEQVLLVRTEDLPVVERILADAQA